ncbi:MAG: TldD/PmbA family protein [Nitrospirae bacterium]|nr:TldD/PmbA family protein [Nitrospirota bacterium]
MNIYTLKSTLKEIVSGMEKKVPYACALAMETIGERVVVMTKESRVEPLDPSRGVVFTAFTGRHFLEYSTGDLTPDSLRKAAKELVRLAELSGIDGDVTIDPGPAIERDFEVPEVIPNESISLSDKVNRCSVYREKLQGMDSRIVNAAAIYAHTRNRELYVNRNKALFQDLKRGQAVIQAVMRDGDDNAQLHAGDSKQGGYENSTIPAAKFAELVHDCGRILNAPRLAPGYYDCIFSPEFAGITAHEAFGHGTESDMFLKDRCRGAEYLGKRVGSDLVNMFDSPAEPGEAASFFFDHEGQLASRTQIIKDGILVSPITELNSATRLGLVRTANGRRESYERKAYARMTNTFFGPGTNSFEEMVASIKSGYLLTHPSNGMEDPKGWGIQLEGYIAEEILDGKLTGRVHTPVIVTGYVPELLQSISMVGDTASIFGLGYCGKGHKEWVKVTDGGPFLKLKARLG